MKYARFLAGLSLLAVALPPAAASAAPPIEAYGQLSDVELIALSPNGQRFAALTTIDGQRMIVVFDAQKRPLKRLPVGEAKIRDFEFATDDTLLIHRSLTQVLPHGSTSEKIELAQAVIAPLMSPDMMFVFKDRKDLLDATFGYQGVRIVDGVPKAFFGGLKLKQGSFGESFVIDDAQFGLYAVDLRTGQSSLVDGGPAAGVFRSWLVGGDGKVAAYLDVNQQTGKWSLRNGSDAQLAEGTSPTGDVSLLAIGAAGTSAIYAVTEPESGGTQWFEQPLAGGAAPQVFLPDTNIRNLYRDPVTKNLVGYREYGKDAVFFDAALAKRAAALTRAFAGRNAEITEFTADLSQAIVTTSGTGDSGSRYLVDLPGKRAEMIAVDRPAIAEADVGPVSRVAYTAADGLEMDGILTLPPGREAKGLPLVVLPHGGPHADDTPVFDWWAQAFAARGYAVFQPNFRGSTGRGADFLRAGYGEWGGKMQSDISDGVAKLAADGIVDPKRACIVGASYGGYAALAGVTLQHGLYRCAVSVAGVSDLGTLKSLESREAGEARVTRRSLAEELGPSSRFRSLSPRHNAAQADAPILLIHGTDDTVVDFAQSKAMADALKSAGKPVEFVTLPGEDHFLTGGETRLAMLKAAVAFVEKHNPAK